MTAPLPSEKPAQRLADIIDNAEAIRRYISGMDMAAFVQNSKTYDAVERCLERISEAAAKLGERLRHQYDEIRAERLWDTVKIDLPPPSCRLRSACGECPVNENIECQPPYRGYGRLR